MGSRKKTAPATPLDIANREIRELEKKLKEKNKRLEEVEVDRDKYRQFFKSEFISQLNCMREKTYYTPEAMIKKITVLLNSCERFYLGF